MKLADLLLLALAGGAGGPALAAVATGLAGRPIRAWAMSLAGGGVGLLVGAAAPPGGPALVGLGLGLSLALLAAIDLAVMRLPDLVTLPLAAAGLLWTALTQASLLDSLIGCSAGYAALALLAVLYRSVRRRAGLGLGDAKLFAAAGAWLGWGVLPQLLLIACGFAFLGLSASVVRGGISALRRPFPFGPSLCLAFFAAWLWL